MNIYQAVALATFLIAFPTWFILFSICAEKGTKEFIDLIFASGVMTVFTVCFIEGIAILSQLWINGKI